MSIVTARINRLAQKLDKEWSAAVRRRDGQCVLCGAKASEKQLYAHHWFAQRRACLALRWDLRNGVSLCYGCHRYKVHMYSDFVHITRMQREAERIYGPGISDKLYAMVIHTPMRTMPDLERERWMQDQFVELGATLEGVEVR